MKQLQAHIEIRKTHCNVWGSSSYDSYSVIVLIRYYRFEAIDISAWFQQGTQAGEAHATIGGNPLQLLKRCQLSEIKVDKSVSFSFSDSQTYSFCMLCLDTVP